MKILRVLLVSVISFCLLNVQMVMTTQGLKLSSNDVYADAPELPGIDGDDGNNGGAGTGSTSNTQCEGVEWNPALVEAEENQANDVLGGATGELNQVKVQQEEASAINGHWLNQVFLLLIGFIVAGWMIKCSHPLPIDMYIATVGGALVLTTEIVQKSMYEGASAQMELAYQADNENKMYRNEQVGSFEKELENQESILKTLGVRKWLQIATISMFGIAFGLALTLSIIWNTSGATCIAAGTALITCPGPCQVQCGVSVAAMGQLMARDAVPSPSVAEMSEKKLTLSTTVTSCPACTGASVFAINQYFAGCIPGSFVRSTPSEPQSFPERMIAEITKDRPIQVKIAKSMAADINRKYFSEDEEDKLEAEKELREEIIHDSLVENGFKNMKSFGLNQFPIQSVIKSNNELHHYIQTYERNNYLNGKIQSISLDQFNSFSELYDYSELKGDNKKTFKEILSIAASKGIDLFFPKAHADFSALMPVLSVAGGALAALAFGVDFMVGAGIRRTIVYGVFTAVTGVALGSTIDSIKRTEDNIARLKNVLCNLSDLNSMGDLGIGSTPGATGGTTDIPGGPEINQNEDIPLNLDGNNPTPCIGGNNSSGGCNSIEKGFKAANSFDGFELDSGLNSNAMTAAQIGDELSGTKNLSSSTLGKIQNLGRNNGAIAKTNRFLRDKLNKQLKKNKLAGLDLGKKSGDLLNNLRSAMLKKMKEEGVNGASLLGNNNLASADLNNKNNQGDKKALGDAKRALEAARGKAVGGKGKRKATKIGFDFGGKNSGLAGSGNAEEMDDPNMIDENEEYVIDDIVDDKDASLWQIISVRYLKSGYNRLRGDKNAPPAKISE